MSIRNIKINGREIGPDQPPYIVAELSANHNGSLPRALELLEAAKAAGADAIKLQTYRPDTITFNSAGEDFQIHGGPWDGKTLYSLYEWAHMPWEWHRPLFEKAHELNITIFSSPFDFSAVDLLESLDAPAYKIASFELVDLPLIRYVAQTGKPLILSTGMASLDEIEAAIETARAAGCDNMIILHCVSGYPAPACEYNLKTIPDLENRFKTLAGLSDHTIDNATAITSIALGACLIEKHFTLDRKGGGPDDSFSLEPKELAALCRDTRIAWQALGCETYVLQQSETVNAQFRRSLYVVKNMQAGERFSPENLRSIRPGFGLPPKHYDEILEKKAVCAITAGTALSWEMIVQPLERPTK